MRRRRVVVSTLGITQTLARGSTYYLAAVFADPISDTLRLPHASFETVKVLLRPNVGVHTEARPCARQKVVLPPARGTQITHTPKLPWQP